MPYLYQFNAKEKQGYIFRSNKLVDMVGGSSIIATLEKAFDKTLAALSITSGDIDQISRQSGSVKVFFRNSAQAEAFFRIWPVVVAKYAPGLTVVQAMVEMDGPKNFTESNEKLRKALDSKRNFPIPAFPEAGPLIERCQRTGFPAVRRDVVRNEEVDRELDRKRKSFEKHKMDLPRILMDGPKEEEWPDEMDEMAKENDSHLAVIHADGNDLGKIIIETAKRVEASGGDPIEAEGELSKVIEKVACAAAIKAFEKVVKPHLSDNGGLYPIRPIIIAGEDFTAVIRADLALKFTKEYLEAFTWESKKHLANAKVQAVRDIEPLTSSAGIVFVKKNFPFSAAYDIAESLCGKTKSQTREKDNRRTPACLAFHRVTDSLGEDANDLFEAVPAGKVVMSCAPYALEDNERGTVKFDDLRELADAMDKMPSSSMRELITTLHTSPKQALDEFNRMVKVKNDREKMSGRVTGEAKKLEEALKRITKNDQNPLITAATPQTTPVLDAWRILEMEK